ncbi:hypothetical protein HQ325_16580 [Rhodococcus sp. BP-349]|uniref:hypothetical protein n=1 Tax=unclassified Rhodococcus (in: high G+C Gram-positive bacteria) TaxID=192944 RepID=UPI001C9B3315|nr:MULTISPECIES: hypothetical protein [unclassified Rhodococcus (in: high G+C Gram-positive bacteria)]MBY6540291.1 hypothetical protein [Rhodococcus sp. BP-363]MBY6545684.1 hypothetical protein [Rhodococcus sp. BP-369]MBY6564914.1 hypothetical protein [Rhodococcus sp. BP-370]MBY6578150.1 hypothetical protein [Rhodococcus sp. BP-364]MBY6587451.1 hypothetical protein [Rhodococcus sp. BP-358]
MRDPYGPSSPSEMPRYVENSAFVVEASDLMVWTEPVRVYESGLELTVHAVSEVSDPVVLDGFEDANHAHLIRVTITTDDGQSDNCGDPRDPRVPDSALILAVKAATFVHPETVAVMFLSPLPKRGDVSIRLDRVGQGDTAECVVLNEALDGAAPPHALHFRTLPGGPHH